MLVRVIGATFRRWRERRRRRAAIRELRALNDRTLKDMGLTRGEIVAAVDGQMYRGEQIPPDQSEPPSSTVPGPTRVEAIDPAGLQGYLDRARQLRADFIAGLLRRGISRMVRLVRRPFRHFCAGNGRAAPPVASSCHSIRPLVTELTR